MSKIFNIVFMGTPDFAVPSLKALWKSKHNVSLVITQPDRTGGRGRRILSPAIKKSALDLGLKMIQPESIKTEAVVEILSEFKPDLFVVVAFGHILSKKLLSLPKLGTINLHASLLPKYRGPAPIQWAIINGDGETGVTTMFMDEGLDTGDILLSANTEIIFDDTSASLHDRLATLGADLLIQTLKRFEDDNIKPVSQDHSRATYAPLLRKKDGHMDWSKSAESLNAFIRGMTPWPGAFTFHGEKSLKIFRAKPILNDVAELPGTVIRGFWEELRIATGKGSLSILEIQGASGKRLLIEDFLRGYNLPAGTVLN